MPKLVQGSFKPKRDPCLRWDGKRKRVYLTREDAEEWARIADHARPVEAYRCARGHWHLGTVQSRYVDHHTRELLAIELGIRATAHLLAEYKNATKAIDHRFKSMCRKAAA